MIFLIKKSLILKKKRHMKFNMVFDTINWTVPPDLESPSSVVVRSVVSVSTLRLVESQTFVFLRHWETIYSRIRSPLFVLPCVVFIWYNIFLLYKVSFNSLTSLGIKNILSYYKIFCQRDTIPPFFSWSVILELLRSYLTC